MSRPVPSPEGLVIALACSRLALPKAAGEAMRPLSTKEWNEVAEKVESPAALLDITSAQLQEKGIAADVAHRLEALLARGGQLALELEQLADRGLWVLTRADKDYPSRLTQHLRERAPLVLYGAGDPKLLSSGGVAIVGSRHPDDAAMQFAARAAELCARDGATLICGAAKGIDRAAMMAALEAGGYAAGVIADNLERMIREPDTRSFVLDGRLTLISISHYAAHFTIGDAMARNKIVYCLADYALVVSAGDASGGTWAGAIEDLKTRWTPLFVHSAAGVPPGNMELLRKGAIALESLPASGLLGALEQVAGEWKEPESAPVVADQFEQSWPALRDFLAEPRSEKEIAAQFIVPPKTAKDWIARALETGRIERAKVRGKRYHLAASLFSQPEQG